jgi:hypothetical protein
MPYYVYRDSISFYGLDFQNDKIKHEHRAFLATVMAEIEDPIKMFDAGSEWLSVLGYENPNAIMPLISRSDIKMPHTIPF